jgi:hypothetical protein
MAHRAGIVVAQVLKAQKSATLPGGKKESAPRLPVRNARPSNAIVFRCASSERVWAMVMPPGGGGGVVGSCACATASMSSENATPRAITRSANTHILPCQDDPKRFICTSGMATLANTCQHSGELFRNGSGSLGIRYRIGGRTEEPSAAQCLACCTVGGTVNLPLDQFYAPRAAVSVRRDGQATARPAFSARPSLSGRLAPARRVKTS